MVKKILIVDDEKMLVDILAGYFGKEKGYIVFTAEDGERAEQIIKREDLDLVLLDMKLPKVDGIEVLKLLREHYPKTKVITMTTYDVKYKKKMDEIGYDYFFMKPLTICDLQDKIEELLALGVSARPERPKETSKESEVVSSEKEKGIPKAKLLIIEPRDNIAALLRDFFQDQSLSTGNYTVSNLHIHNIEAIREFKPDIVLYDIIQIGTFSEFASQLMQLENPPKEIILFGDPSFRWEEVDALIERGMKYIQTPLEVKGKSSFLEDEFGLPSKETVQKLSTSVKNVCLKYGFIEKGGSRCQKEN
jgi:DNA-binding response OmpR family regulator